MFSSVYIEFPFVTFPGVESCDPEDIRCRFLKIQPSISFDIQDYNDDCNSFNVTISNCSSLSNSLCMAATNQTEHVRDELVTQCLTPDFSYPTGLKIVIKWDDMKCTADDNGCTSTQTYLPSHLIETG